MPASVPEVTCIWPYPRPNNPAILGDRLAPVSAMVSVCAAGLKPTSVSNEAASTAEIAAPSLVTAKVSA